jgi:hypothetical protein
VRILKLRFSSFLIKLFSEWTSGSDAFALKTTAKKDAQGNYVLFATFDPAYCPNLTPLQEWHKGVDHKQQ